MAVNISGYGDPYVVIIIMLINYSDTLLNFVLLIYEVGIGIYPTKTA